MSHSRPAGYDPRAFAHPSSRQSLISNRHRISTDCGAVHALRHRNQDKFLFLLETFEEKTYRAIEVSFPKPPDTNISGWETVDMQPNLPVLVCPTISIYPENNIHTEIKEFKSFSSHSIASTEQSDLLKLFSELKEKKFEYKSKLSTRAEQQKVLNSILEPLYKIVPTLKEGIRQFPEVEKRSGCAIS